MITRATSVCKDQDVTKHLSYIHDKYVVVQADKVPNNIVFVYITYLIMLDKRIGY